jgi:hypothetical protein
MNQVSRSLRAFGRAAGKPEEEMPPPRALGRTAGALGKTARGKRSVWCRPTDPRKNQTATTTISQSDFMSSRVQQLCTLRRWRRRPGVKKMTTGNQLAQQIRQELPDGPRW